MMGNSGTKGDLTAVQVVKHIPYNKGAADEFDDIGGTSVSEPEAELEGDDLPF